MTAYASNTSVSAARSRAEIEDLVLTHGGDRFGYMSEEMQATIGFELNERAVKFTVPLPDRGKEEFWNTPGGRRQRTPEQAYKAWEQSIRQKWRALYLVIRAKIEAVESGVTTFEEEFLAHFVMPGGKTVGETIIPQMVEGKMPRLMLTSGSRR